MATHQSVLFQKKTSASHGTIDLLREYRSALITVTGQLNLRHHEKKMEALV